MTFQEFCGHLAVNKDEEVLCFDSFTRNFSTQTLSINDANGIFGNKLVSSN